MTSKFKVGDHVTWNSGAGRVSGKIIKVHIRNILYKGYTITRALTSMRGKPRPSGRGRIARTLLPSCNAVYKQSH